MLKQWLHHCVFATGMYHHEWSHAGASVHVKDRLTYSKIICQIYTLR